MPARTVYGGTGLAGISGIPIYNQRASFAGTRFLLKRARCIEPQLPNP
ncbi:hypothetical protein SBF1_1030011 [Candidatus Desulfosporosinus infrequens]|uniref:Uncharacterized protein n=1 Tax=Candidatus Desulfosporosinus infrequens TaxID=2043169 RepID=A0A2U3JWP9_9FIRM|nr:hypothetical protein SBF1_1030011 [Candidatus Desulfosporosinus infrequens]